MKKYMLLYNGKSIPRTTKERRLLIRSELKTLVGSGINCPGLKNRPVVFTEASLKETAAQAGKSYSSTLVALHVVKAIQVAKLEKENPPDSKKQLELKFQKMYVLRGRLDVGSFKLMVGEKKDKRILHYCITDGKGKRRLVHSKTTTPTSPLSRCKGRKRN